MLSFFTSEKNLLEFGNEVIRLKAVVPGIELIGHRTPMPIFGTSNNKEAFLAGMEGNTKFQQAFTGTLRVNRELFTEKNGNILAMRFTLINESEEILYLDKMSAFTCSGDESFIVGGHMEDFRCLKLGRHKLDVPTVFRPATVDDCYRDASFQAHKLRAGMGVQGNTQDFYSFDHIYSEPAFFVKNDKKDDLPGLGMCVLGQSKHLTSFILSPASGNKELRKFDVSMEFDGIRLLPGDSVQTHWLVFYTARTENEALERYSKILASHTGLTPPNNKFTLYCSWYFYGREFYEEDLIENVRLLKEKHIPVDAFIIDNGWMDNFGDFNANKKFPSGMAKIAEIIGESGFAPGIWTCPFLLMPHSDTFKAHPELAAKNRQGEYSMFHYIECDCHIVDPTSAYCKEYFNELYDKINSWGYTYHKMDFMRAPTVNSDIVFGNEDYNRASAYRLGHELLRQAIGKGAYFLSCGGIYDAGTLGIADSVRTGSDSIGSWENPFAGREGGSKIQVKQTMFRNYLNHFCNTDPDSLMLRRREQTFREHVSPIHNVLSNGLFTDSEAQTMVCKQYICGGNVNFSERIAELPEDRLKLLSTVIPPIAPAAKTIDFYHPDTPTLCLTEFDHYQTLTVFNWNDELVFREISIAQLNLPKTWGQIALFEFFSQSFLGIVEAQGTIRLNIPAHGAVCVRLTPVQEGKAFLIGTDCHMSMGGYEVTELNESAQKVEGRICSKWKYPVRITVLQISDEKISYQSKIIENGEAFCISF